MTSTKVKVVATILAVFLFLILYLYYFPNLLNSQKLITNYKKDNNNNNDYSLDEQIHKFMFMQDKLYEEIHGDE